MPLKCEMWVRIPFDPQMYMELQLIHSKAQRLFKRKMGQANHFLITILIGLDEVGKGNVKKPETLDVSWNPQDVTASVKRSREYALNSSLAWIIDNFDSYVHNCKRKPCIFEDKILLSEIDNADRSVNDKFIVLFNRYKSIEEINKYGALLELGIQWRNIVTHSEAKNTLDKEYKEILLDNRDWYYDNFCHLNVDDALGHFKNHKSPTLKETTSIIKTILKFVELVDSELVKELDVHRYIYEILEVSLSAGDIKGGQNQRCQLLTLSKERQLSRITNFLLNNGFVETREKGGYIVDESFIRNYLEIEL